MAEQSSQYIFLVDDEPIQNEMLKDYLSERFKYKFMTFESGEAAIKELYLNPAIIVLDFHLNAHLPEAKNGVEVLKDIKAQRPDSHVIMLSGQDKLDVAVDSMKYGAYDYVIKGETAFSRMENIINNINVLGNVKQANNTYKKVITALCVAIGAIVLLSAYLVAKLK
ncbi:MAG: histidine kinase [Flavipsychrobacter sp.]|nr:histidine kinase [Flavipsychrobacter sp.]